MNFIKQKFVTVRKTIIGVYSERGTLAIFPYLLDRVTHYLFFFIKFIITLPIASILIALRPFKEIYLVMLLSSRIGHFAANTELMLLKEHKEIYSKKKLFLFYEEELVCNTQLSKMWKRVLPVLPFPRICREVDKTMSLLLGGKYKYNVVKSFEDCRLGRDHQQLLETRNTPYIYFTPREVSEAEKRLNAFGVEKGKQFVCLLVRDAGYLNHRAPGKNLFSHHDYRNADITSYRKAALFLAEKGYVVFRMGKHVEKKFNVEHPNVIDYANHPKQCDLLDIYLPAHCTFMISTATGLDGIAQLFRRPLLFTDLSPILFQVPFWYPSVMFIIKKIRYRHTNAILTFRELEKEFIDVRDLTMQASLREKNVEIVTNTEEEIFDAVTEMELRIKNTWIETEQSNQLRNMFFQECFPPTLIFNELRFSLEKIKIKMGSKFLQENTALFS
ncbi:MAG: hypothetical protein A3I77_03920 [Gammaproteobacteria bacterium RIFCSPLOWO2_02_FULL_42_14]|nr:MAG: hypothetical protein A3B71_05225 [Gammaproteobacteria bacterium RIFCSPHIGHO2_02_FULL_42_43]OGT28545.1 MAG: hypothetical protein A2624_03985 [Gammaproteobacteria bacterium RIFCSPHIGHO2_01_FULL_42_8]OGT51399.1 MAG: hypothetical protein A3E54_04990 [Gammaproteobacteria bacterium RIFCSPHIGHO2_12_FULL_41_25]OGT62101.1 MAG: hypothetical protein A3I77_03920 [Gammaproteobacteria bacterium RIFCSPLOWO2_02_FULL_42_14]OGT85773.1 MAG: hypothetical protein A3G86_03615 [Gammaproteobacteria bacterium R